MDLTQDDVGLIRQQGDLRTYLAGLQAEARATNKRNRALVLANPDLAHQLTQPPLSFERPDQWTGYVPGDLLGGQPNRSHYRTAAADLVAEAERRATT